MPAYSTLALAVALTTLSPLYKAAAFTNKLPTSIHHHTTTGHNQHNSPPITIRSSTALFYKHLQDSEESPPDQQQQQSQEVFLRSKKRNNKKLLRKKKNKKRSYTTAAKLKHKKNVPVESPEELASHVQSIFSDFREYSHDIDEVEFNNSSSDDDSSSDDSSSQNDRGIMKQNSLLLDNHPALVLNADYQPLRMLPLSTWSWQNTVKAVLSGKAVVVDVYPDLFVRAVRLDIPVPSVIALREYAPTGKAKPAFTRRNVFLRDGYRCQYCSNLFRTSDLSLDHVMPRCLGGKLTWENTVTCCKKCNGRKGSLLPTELDVVGMELKREPRCPSLYELASEAGKFVPRRVHPTWEPFLGGGGNNVGKEVDGGEE